MRGSTDCNAGDDASAGNVEHQYLAVGERHEAELPVAGDGDRLRGTAHRVNSNDSTLAGGNIGGKTTRDADILRFTSNWHRAKQVSVHFEDREGGGPGDPELIGS